MDGQHIGMVSSYFLDEDLKPTPWDAIDQSKNAAENHSVRGLGIEICKMSFWGKGIGPKVLTALMEYYPSLGEYRFILETWTGNTRMLSCARKLGFVEVGRKKDVHFVNGKAYDDVMLEKHI